MCLTAKDMFIFVFSGDRNIKFVWNVVTRNWDIVQCTETIKYGNGCISTECKAIDDIGTHLILNTAVALLPSDTSGNTRRKSNNAMETK